MRIKTSGQSHILYRYGGQVDGKAAEMKIGSVSTGTAPDDIPVALLNNLTPNEARDLREHLEREQIDLARTKLSIVASDIIVAAGLVTEKTLDAQTAVELNTGLTKLRTVVNRVLRAHQSNMPAAAPVVSASE